MKFIDSCRFMASSLDKLSSYLVGTSGLSCNTCKKTKSVKEIDEDYHAIIECSDCDKITKISLNRESIEKNFKQLFEACLEYDEDYDCDMPNDEKFRLLLRKGVFPYEHIEGFENFGETELPPKEKFYSKLTGCGISDTDYEHAKKVWKTFNMKNMGDYHDL